MERRVEGGREDEDEDEEEKEEGEEPTSKRVAPPT
jgi:hypothetical protein